MLIQGLCTTSLTRQKPAEPSTVMRLKIYTNDYVELDAGEVIDEVYKKKLNPNQYLVLLQNDSKVVSDESDAITQRGPTTREGVVSNGQHNEGTLEEGCDA